MILAQITNIMGVEINTLVQVGTAVGVLWALWKKTNSAKADIVKEIKRELRLDEAEGEEGQKRMIGPQPFQVAMHSECVKRGSYETHCRLNREAHERIERDVKKEIEKIADLHHSLSREVSEINARSETNEARLIQIDTKLDNIRTQITNK
jgi:hypothetical protein